MSIEEDSDLGITPSADDILEVSPVNSYANSNSQLYFSNPSPTASLGNRRSNTNVDAFSSSSEGPSDDEGGSQSGNSGSESGSASASGSGSEDDEDDPQNSYAQRQSRPPPKQQHRSNSRPGASTSPKSSSQQQQRDSRRNNQYAPSEFDKALLTGVPSRGYATSFFSADSTDASEGTPTVPHPADAISGAGIALSTVDKGAPDGSSWEGDATEASNIPPIMTAPRHGKDGQDKKKKDGNHHHHRHHHHRVNITTTTQQPSSTSSVVSAASSSNNNNINSTTNTADPTSALISASATTHPVPPTSSTSLSSSSNAGIPTTTTSTQHSLHADSIGSTMDPNNHNINNNHHQNSKKVEQDLSSGVLPDVLMTMRQKIESMQFFDSDMMKSGQYMDEYDRESLKRSSQQSISAAVLVSLAHKRYERRRLAAMEIEKVVRSLVIQNELERVRAILLLLSDDYVRSTSEDARKGGVVALAACAIGLKKAHDDAAMVMECRDLILASVVHACQDHSQRVRYYATESLFNVVKVIPGLAVQHFFILFEILRSLYADVDVDVRSGAELLDKKLKEVIVGAMNSGSFSTDACVPVFARFVCMRNKATKRLTLTWLQELNEKLIGAPILEFLHLFLAGIFDMVADPSLAIRQSALAFLQSVLPKLLVVNSEAIADMDHAGMRVDFDKILQSLVTTMEHPDPFVRKVAMYWMSRIVKAHMKDLHDRTKATVTQASSPVMMNPDGRMSPNNRKTGATKGEQNADERNVNEDSEELDGEKGEHLKAMTAPKFSAASMSVRNSLPHVLPGILLSIGDTFNAKGNSTKDSFLPDVTTNELAEQTNACLRDAVRRDGKAYIQHLDSFIVALREELDSPGGLSARNPPAEERRLYRIDVNRDGTGIESPGWFRASHDTKERNEESMVSSRLCALHWVIVLYESVVPDALKAEYAREFINPIIHQLVDNPPEKIVFKSLEVLAKITVPVSGEEKSRQQQETQTASTGSSTLSHFNTPPPSWASPIAKSEEGGEEKAEFPMTDASISYALDILHPTRRKLKSRDREVFTALIQLHSYNQQLLADLSRLITFMCRMQPPEFVFVSFAVELDRFVRRLKKQKMQQQEAKENEGGGSGQARAFSNDLEFVSSFVQQMCHVLLNAEETKPLRDGILRDCVGYVNSNPKDLRRVRLFHILLHSFSHSIVATVSLCLWGAAYRTASQFLSRIVPLDINLIFLLELDKLVEQLERPLFRHLHVRMLERNEDPAAEGSGAMLFKTLKLFLMIIPQSTCYNVLKDRLKSIANFRKSTVMSLIEDDRGNQTDADKKKINEQTEAFVARVLDVRAMHCDAMWETIRAESLETQAPVKPKLDKEEGESRREWLGYASKEEQRKAEERYRLEKLSQQQGNGLSIEEIKYGYQDLGQEPTDSAIEQQLHENFAREDDDENDCENPPPLRKGEHSTEAVLQPREVEKESKDDDAWKEYWANG